MSRRLCATHVYVQSHATHNAHHKHLPPTISPRHRSISLNSHPPLNLANSNNIVPRYQKRCVFPPTMQAEPFRVGSGSLSRQHAMAEETCTHATCCSCGSSHLHGWGCTAAARVQIREVMEPPFLCSGYLYPEVDSWYDSPSSGRRIDGPKRHSGFLRKALTAWEVGVCNANGLFIAVDY